MEEVGVLQTWCRGAHRPDGCIRSRNPSVQRPGKKTVQDAAFGGVCGQGSPGRRKVLPQPSSMEHQLRGVISPAGVRRARSHLQDVPLWRGAKAYCVGEGEADRWPARVLRPAPHTPPGWFVSVQTSLVTSLFPHSPMLSAPAAGPHARPGLPERRKPLLASQRGCGANRVLQEGPAATGPAYQPAASWRLTTSDSQWSNGGRRCSGPRPGWAQVCLESWLSEPQAGCTFLLSGAILVSRTGVERANLTGPSEHS